MDFNELHPANIESIYVTDEVLNIKGNSEVYNLISKLSKINFRRFKVKNELHILLDKAISDKTDNSEKIERYLINLIGR